MTDVESRRQTARQQYLERMASLRNDFMHGALGGLQAARERAVASDALLAAFWQAASVGHPELQSGVAIVAVGGFGRRELFPCSDLDVLFCVGSKSAEEGAKETLRRVSQWLWDTGLRVAATTRQLTECQRVDADNVEFACSLLDARTVCGDQTISKQLLESAIPQLIRRDRSALTARLRELTQERHSRYGNTLFHLEPNIKECPGGLRDHHVSGWLNRLADLAPAVATDVTEAVAFLAAVRCFLHFRANRDVNTLDWKTQDEAAAAGIGTPDGVPRDAAHWMQLYFRHARTIARTLEQQIDSLPTQTPTLQLPSFSWRKKSESPHGIQLRRGRVALDAPNAGSADPAEDAATALRAFQLVSETGARLDLQSVSRLAECIPALSVQFDDGALLWQRLKPILAGQHAGLALRSMHEVGLLELLLPEFHGIDALVVRDAYHRYTVDEHTFVVLDTLHGLTQPGTGWMAQWKAKFAVIARDLQHPELLYLAALLHDTGKGRSTGEHTQESARLATSVLARLDLDEYASRLVLTLIRNHLEMSAALRRDIFDPETVRAFAAIVHAPEELRMLTLFTYADIQAVHPDALTPWKAENLWRLYMATSNYLDRNMDDERVDARVSSDLVLSVAQSLPQESREVLKFLEGFPQRYLETRSPEQIRTQYSMSRRLSIDPVQLDFVWQAERSEITLVTPDRHLLFSRIVGMLTAWGMNIITADAFSNARGIVVDSFRFTDGYRTLEKNVSERERLVNSIHDAIADPALAAQMVASRKHSRRKPALVEVARSVHFDIHSSSHSTVLQVIAQDVPGLLYDISTVLGEADCDIRVAVIDTEGETAIDVFYLTRQGEPLPPESLPELRTRLMAVIDSNAS